MQDLDDALSLMQNRVGVLRDTTIKDTGAGVKNIQAQMDDLRGMNEEHRAKLDRLMNILADTNRHAKCA
jgi:hypothetical protein